MRSLRFCHRKTDRHGLATLDYVMVSAVILPVTAFLFWAVYRLFVELYMYLSTVLGWPFL